MERTGWFNTALLSTLMLGSSLMVACGGKGDRHYDILSDSSEYVQSASFKPRNVDILWVIDNSGSMQNSQENLAASFNSFITRFQDLDSDFRMAVITSEAYRTQFNGGTDISLFRNGMHFNAADNQAADPSGYSVLDNSVAPEALESAFIKNIMQGTDGNGDERVFQSIEVALNNTGNTNFRRPGAYLAVIIVSDEEDFSHNASYNYLSRAPSQTVLHTPQRYVDFLAEYTNALPKEDFSVSAIGIYDQQCLDLLAINGQRLAPRMQEIVRLTGGVEASICDNFGESLQVISQSILELASSFKLARVPIVETIRVTVEGRQIEPSSIDGWEYLSAENLIQFNGSAVPQQGASVQIDFDPIELKK